MRHETAVFGQQKTKFINSSYHFFCFSLFFSFNNKKTQKSAETPIFIVFQQPKKENFQTFNLKQRNLKNPIFAPFFQKKKLFLENWQITGHKKTQNDN